MTCIIGLEHDGKVSIGGDSAGVNGSLDIRIRTDEKVFINGPMIFGFTSSFRMGQLLRYSLKVPEQLGSETDDYKFMCTRFIDEVRTCLKNGGYASVKNGVDEGGYFLVGYRGKLYRVESDFQVGKSVQPYEAVGCGEAFAMGAMRTIFGLSGSDVSGRSLDPAEKIRMALSTASVFSAGVSAPFFVLQSDGEKKEFTA